MRTEFCFFGFDSEALPPMALDYERQNEKSATERANKGEGREIEGENNRLDGSR